VKVKYGNPYSEFVQVSEHTLGVVSSEHTANSKNVVVALGDRLGVKCFAQGHLSHFLPVLRIEPATFGLPV